MSPANKQLCRLTVMAEGLRIHRLNYLRREAWENRRAADVSAIRGLRPKTK